MCWWCAAVELLSLWGQYSGRDGVEIRILMCINEEYLTYLGSQVQGINKRAIGGFSRGHCLCPWAPQQPTKIW